jgi:predicted nucleic-acid-binding Zn-ribbon protein
VCRTNEWAPNQKIAHLPNAQSAIDGTMYPVVLIYCKNCGYTLPINALVAGIEVR